MARAGIDRIGFCLPNFHSIDWQSLTFIGERHEISLRVPGPTLATALARLRDGLAEAELPLPAKSSPTS